MLEAWEIVPQLAHALRREFPAATVRAHDFLTFDPNPAQLADAVVMNPPFANGADILHILHAARFLKPGGRLVAICAGGPRQASALRPLASHWEPLPAGTFAEAGTQVSTVLLVIDAPPADRRPDDEGAEPNQAPEAAPATAEAQRDSGGQPRASAGSPAPAAAALPAAGHIEAPTSYMHPHPRTRGNAQRPPTDTESTAMSPKHLTAIRKMLHFSVAEAARYATASSERLHGVEDRTWNRWEAGQAPIPPNVVHTMLRMAAWRRLVLAGLKAQHADALAGKAPAPAALLWYDELEDWPGEAIEWRPWQSAAASLLDHAAEVGQPEAFRLVRFNAQAYHRQRRADGLPDTEQQRQAWAHAQPDDTPVWRTHGADADAFTPTPV